METIKFTAPNYEKLTLPSNGFGPQGIKELLVRPMTMKEEKLLTNKTVVKSGKVQEEINKAVVKAGYTESGQEVAIEWDKMLAEDEYAIALFVRAISYGRKYEPTITCPECKKKQEISIDIETDLPVKMATASTFKDGMQVKLPKDGRTVTLRFPTKKDVGNDVYDTISNVIETTSGIEKAMVPTWLETLTAIDIAALRNAIKKPGYGIANSIKFICPNDKCDSDGEEQEITLPITSEFFRI